MERKKYLNNAKNLKNFGLIILKNLLFSLYHGISLALLPNLFGRCSSWWAYLSLLAFLSSLYFVSRVKNINALLVSCKAELFFQLTSWVDYSPNPGGVERTEKVEVWRYYIYLPPQVLDFSPCHVCLWKNFSGVAAPASVSPLFILPLWKRVTYLIDKISVWKINWMWLAQFISSECLRPVCKRAHI